MRPYIVLVVIIVILLYPEPSRSESLRTDACRVTVMSDENNPVDRRMVFDLVKQKSLLVCPFSDRQPVVFLQDSCSPHVLDKLGKYTVEHFDTNGFFSEAIKCTPLMGIQTADYKPGDPVVSYLVFDGSEKFESGMVRKRTSVLIPIFGSFLIISGRH